MNHAETLHEFLRDHADSLAMRTAEHLQLTAITVLVALVLGVLLSVATYRRARLWMPLLAATSVLQTVPGIALLVIMLAAFGRIGMLPALASLILYALLPIVQNTLVGLNSLSPTLVEAARGIGLDRWQRLRFVRLPLALPMIIAGLRTAAVQTVGLATLAAFIGAGGLGQFINRGLFLSDTRLILLGAIPAALMALYIHFLLGLFGYAATPGREHRTIATRGAITMLLGALLLGWWLAPAKHAAARDTIVIGSKNFTEQLIIAEMVAQQIEQTTPLHVERRFGLGGSSVMQQALVEHEIDLGVEYTGTALSAILHQPAPKDAKQVFPTVQREYARQYHLRWLPPLGFNNSYQLAIRNNDPKLGEVRSISQLVAAAPKLTAAFDFEFAERADGYAGLKKTYGLQFGKVIDMHPDLLYDALRKGNVDVISAYATEGRIARYDLRNLTDDKHFFPPYEAAIVVNEQTLAAHPELEPALRKLSGTLSDARMRAFNEAVDSKRLTVEEAAEKARKMMPN